MTSNILVERENIGIFGKTNAGKSTLINILTNQETSIVDEKAGTTADVKQTVLEIHNFGPVKLFDTAGLNEDSKLGKKKRFKALQTLKECDLILLIIDPRDPNTLSVENEVISLSMQYEKQIFLVYNIFNSNSKEEIEKIVEKCNENIFNSWNLKKIVVNLHSKNSGKKLLEFIKSNYVKKTKKQELIPFLKPQIFVGMNIPIDEETPAGRLLRPQNVVLDFLLRRMIPFAGFRMDLLKARSSIENVREEEKKNYLNFLNEINGKYNGLQLLITDSQAIDVVDRWTPKTIPVTTFSITMINFQSNGNLKRLVEGLEVVKTLQDGDKIAVAEACNHNRTCEDIGTVQIPRRLKNKLGIEPDIDFIFGRAFPSEKELKKYKLMIHCGGCMIDSQKVNARMNDLLNLKIPITNYGLLLSYLQGEETLKRVLEPWRII